MLFFRCEAIAALKELLPKRGMPLFKRGNAISE
jgi:hypothetical protein